MISVPAAEFDPGNPPDETSTIAEIEHWVGTWGAYDDKEVMLYRMLANTGLQETTRRLHQVIQEYKQRQNPPALVHMLMLVRPGVYRRFSNGMVNHPQLKGQLHLNPDYDQWNDLVGATKQPLINFVESQTGLIPTPAINHIAALLNWQTDETSTLLRLSLSSEMFPLIINGSADALAWMLQTILIRHNPQWWAARQQEQGQGGQ